MRSRLLTLATLSAALLVPAAAAHAADCAGQDLVPDATNTAQVADATLCLLNDQRSANGLAALSADERLNTSSTNYAGDMVAGQFFAHESPSGNALENRLATVGYSFDIAGENIAWGEGGLATPAQIVNAWMHSDGHRENILDGSFRQIGLGIVPALPVASQIGGATYVTDFGTPDATPAPATRSVPQKATLAVHAAGTRSSDPIAHYSVKRANRHPAHRAATHRKHAKIKRRKDARVKHHKLHHASRTGSAGLLKLPASER